MSLRLPVSDFPLWDLLCLPRTRNFELQTSKDTNFDKIDQFTRENEAFRENPLVSDFLAAELAFCRMMQEIGLYVTDQMKFE